VLFRKTQNKTKPNKNKENHKNGLGKKNKEIRNFAHTKFLRLCSEKQW